LSESKGSPGDPRFLVLELQSIQLGCSAETLSSEEYSVSLEVVVSALESPLYWLARRKLGGGFVGFMCSGYCYCWHSSQARPLSPSISSAQGDAQQLLHA